jgi:hypothetical protein
VRSIELPPTASESTPELEALSRHGDGGASPGARNPAPGGASRRRPGRPLEVPPEQVLGTIRRLAQDKDGLFRVHLEAPDLYARARRLFGSWSAAVRRAGLDYEALRGAARARSIQSRRRNRRRGPR